MKLLAKLTQCHCIQIIRLGTNIHYLDPVSVRERRPAYDSLLDTKKAFLL